MPETAKTATSPQDLDTIIPFRASERNENARRDPFAGGRQESNPSADMIRQELEAQNLRLKGNLDDADRKNRELMDEVFQLKRQLAQDNTETKLSHQAEVHKMEREHDKEIRELEKEILELKNQARFKDLEYSQGETDIWSKIIKIVENNGGEFFTQVLAGLQNMNGPQQPPQQYTPEQLQAAMQQAAEYQQQNGLAGTEHAEAQQPDPAADAPENAQPNPQQPQNQQPTPQQMNKIKETLKSRLIDGALAALTNENVNLEKYSQQVRNQLALYRQQGITLDAQAWTEMANVLAETAIEREITAERVTKVVQPALEGVKQYGMFLKMIEPGKATDMLFNQFNIQAGPPVRKLVTKVLSQIQKSIK